MYPFIASNAQGSLLLFSATLQMQEMYNAQSMVHTHTNVCWLFILELVDCVRIFLLWSKRFYCYIFTNWELWTVVILAFATCILSFNPCTLVQSSGLFLFLPAYYIFLHLLISQAYAEFIRMTERTFRVFASKNVREFAVQHNFVCALHRCVICVQFVKSKVVLGNSITCTFWTRTRTSPGPSRQSDQCVELR